MLIYANMYSEKECRDGKEIAWIFSKIEDNCNSQNTKKYEGLFLKGHHSEDKKFLKEKDSCMESGIIKLLKLFFMALRCRSS